MSADRITVSCRSGNDDCTADCGWCKGTGVEKLRINDLSVARRVAEDFQSFEAHEMPLFLHDRDVEIVLWALRCLANPRNDWSTAALAGLVAAARDAATTAAGDDTRRSAGPGDPYRQDEVIK